MKDHLKMEYRPIKSLKELPNNPRQIKKDQFERLKKSIADNADYFEARPIILSDRTGEFVVIAGNQRLKASKALGLTEVPTVLMSGLSEEREREIIIRDNVENGEWDFDLLANEWEVGELEEWGVGLKGFGEEWRNIGKDGEKTGNDEYDEFTEKFKPKLTTDDCFTPPAVFEAIEKWVRNEYKEIEGLKTFRPFKPDGDYKKEDYTGKVVIDNPPFSIESEIIRFYVERGIKFFLFAPTLTFLSSCIDTKVSRVLTASGIKYENGAVVNTSFITNIEPEDVVIRACYPLAKAIEDAQPSEAKELEKYKRPKNINMASELSSVIKAKKDRRFTDKDCILIKNLDQLKEMGKCIYGGGLMFTDEAADKIGADKSAADKIAADKIAIKVGLSEREHKMLDELNSRSTKNE